MASADESSQTQNQLWWLRLGPAGRSIDDAGPLIEACESGWHRELHPAVAAGVGRAPTLAFLAVKNRGDGRSLFTAEIRFDPATGGPRVARQDLRLIARECRGCPPAFSPDGRHLYYLPGSADALRFACHELAP